MLESPPTTPGPIVRSKPSRKWVVLVIAAAILLSAVAAVMLTAIMLPSVSAARTAAARMKGKLQLDQLVLALDVYASKHGGAFPPDAAAWQDELLGGGVATADLFTAPQASPGMVSYYYVPGRTSDDAGRVILYENPDLHEESGGGGYVVLVGGNVEWIDGPAFLARIDAITLADGTPYGPHREDD